MKCRTPFRFVAAADIQDYDFTLRCLDLVQRYGLCSLSAAVLCTFAIDLYQKGILTKEDTDGMHLEWGNAEVFLALLEKIGRREGIGNVLTNGVYEAARQIGRGTEQYAYHVRKLEPRTRGLGAYRAGTGLTDDRRAYFLGPEAAQYARKHRPETIYGPQRGLVHDRLDRATPEVYLLSDICGLCIYCTGFKPFIPIQKCDQVELLSYTTGLDLDEKELRKYIRRTRALIRAYNAILGERQTIDDLDTLYVDAAERFSPEMRDEMSKLMAEASREWGFNPEGIPTGEALEEISLGYVAQELERRGILPKPVSVPVA